MSPEERRRYIRFSIQGKVTLKPQDNTLRIINADLIDICFIGVGLYASEKIEEGKLVKLELISKFFPGVITGEGRVVNQHEVQKSGMVFYRIGIEFTDIDKTKIKEIINQIQANLCVQARKNKG